MQDCSYYRERTLVSAWNMQPPEVTDNHQQQQRQQEEERDNIQQLPLIMPEALPAPNVNSQLPSVLPMPIGLRFLLEACSKAYPDQINPLQVSTLVKFWLGGPDPLDYISMYNNPGNEEEGIPPHWHYVSFGLSDLHGDARVHVPTDLTSPSGFGFELTFRLRKNSDETNPPTWPAAVMQVLAKYVFQTENILCEGDHVSWHCPLDSSDSRIHHMLMTKDPQLKETHTPFGLVTFIQIVGVCTEELQAAQQWNGMGVINLMKNNLEVGGPWLVTDMRRGATIFELDPDVRVKVDEGVAEEGSNLSGVSAHISYSDKLPKSSKTLYDEEKERLIESSSSENENKESLSSRANIDSLEVGPSRHSAMSVSHDRNSRMSFTSETEAGTNELMELCTTQFFDSLALTFNYEAGHLMPLVLKGRLQHGRHFTFKSLEGDLAVTFLTASISGSVFVDYEQPYGKQGPWLQVLLPEEFILKMLQDLEQIKNIDKKTLPVTYKWDDINFAITLVPEEPTSQQSQD